jgi:hypothetical protein
LANKFSANKFLANKFSANKFSANKLAIFFKWKSFLQTHAPITKAARFFHTLFALRVSTLNWVLFRCSLGRYNWTFYKISVVIIFAQNSNVVVG